MNSGIQLSMDMAQVATETRDITVITSFMKSICGSYEFNIEAQIETEKYIVYMINDGHFIMRIVNSKLFLDLYVLKNSHYMPQIHHIKQQALDFFSPQVYQAHIKPRTAV